MSLSEVLPVFRELAALVFYAFWFFALSASRRIWPAAKKSLSGRTAVVTGAGHGMGREFALQLSKLGVDVICWDIDMGTCSETVDEVKAQGGRAWAFQCDVREPELVAKAAEQSRLAAVNPVSLLINNAGILKPCKPFLDQTADEVRNIFSTNTFSQMWLVKEFFGDLSVAPEANIVSMCSTAGVTGTPNMSTYCATKHALNGFMEALYLELQPHPNVRLTTVYPFVINTGFAKRPLSRFKWLIPFTSTDEAVTTVLDGVRRDERHIYVPGRLEIFFNAAYLLPFKFKTILFDFLGCGVLRHENAE